MDLSESPGRAMETGPPHPPPLQLPKLPPLPSPTHCRKEQGLSLQTWVCIPAQPPGNDLSLLSLSFHFRKLETVSINAPQGYGI